MHVAERKTEPVNVWLTPEQVAWLKTKKNVSETVRALVTEAMSMEKLAESVRKKANKASGAGRQASARKYADARGLTPDASVVYQRQPTVTGTYSQLTRLPLIHWYFVST